MMFIALRALQNPGLFKYDHYRQAALAVCAGIVIRLLVAAPVKKGSLSLSLAFQLIISAVQIFGIKVFIWALSFVVDFESATWDDKLVGGLDFIANSVLQVPFFLMSLMRYITPTLDEMYAFLSITFTPQTPLTNPPPTQVHGLPPMGRQDLHAKTRSRRPRHPPRNVLPKPPSVRHPRGHLQAARAHGCGHRVPSEVWSTSGD